MNTLLSVLIAFIAVFHLYIFFLESIAWESARTRNVFGTTPESAATTRVLAFNQGFYNLFVAAGLAWSLLAADPFAFQLKCFFLACVIVAGIVGGISVSKKIFFVQAAPAIIALALLFAVH